MKTLLTLGMCAMLACHVSAKGEADSLRNELSLAKPEDKGMLYCRLSYHFTFNEPDSAFKYIDQGLQFLADREQDTIVAILYNLRGIALDVAGDQEAALEQYDSALAYAKKSGITRIEASALNNIGLIKWNRGDWEAAIDYYVRSVKLFEQGNNFTGIGNTYNNIGLIFNEEGNYDKALEYFRKALKVRENLGDKAAAAATLNNIALLMFEFHPDSVKHYLDKSIQLRLEVNDQYGLAKGYNNLAIWYDTISFDSSIHYYQKGLQIYKELGYEQGIASSMLNLGGTYAKAGMLEESKRSYDTALALADSLGMKKVAASVHGNLGMWHARKGDYKLAYEETRKYQELHQELQDLEKAEKIQEIEIRYQTEKKEKRILQLDKEKAEASLKIQRQKSLIITLVGGVLCVAFLALFIIYSRKKRAQAESARKELQFRKKLLDSTVLAQEEERQRIAKDLHDGLVQTLAAIKIGFQNLGRRISMDDENTVEFQKHIKFVDDAANEARALSHQMMPRALVEKGLISALEDMLQKTLSPNKIEYTYECFIDGSERFDTAIETGLYRICQEMINNIIKHSGAGQVTVQLLKTKTHLVLHIEDNGKGFSFSHSREKAGIGLSNIFSRASAVNGEVNYEQAKPKGTVANVRVPLAI